MKLVSLKINKRGNSGWESEEITFGGHVTHHDPERKLDTGILQAAWFSVDEINQMRHRHRSPLVMQCIQDHLTGKRYPLELLKHYES